MRQTFGRTAVESNLSKKLTAESHSLDEFYTVEQVPMEVPKSSVSVEQYTFDMNCGTTVTEVVRSFYVVTVGIVVVIVVTSCH